MSLEAHASADVMVKVRCEKCRHIYDYVETMHASRTSITESRAAEELGDECAKELRAILQACAKGRHLGFKKCPQCSHVQSWMMGAQEAAQQDTLRIISGFLAFISCVALYHLKFGLERIWEPLWLAVFALIGFLTYKLMRLILTMIRRPKETRKGPSGSGGPLEIKVTKEPSVTVWRKTVQ